MDPEYIAQLLQLLQAQQGGQMPLGGGFDAFAPSGGFPSPPMPNGKMPQYRTQGSGFVSDGTVKDMMNKVLTNQDDFSADAFFDLDPALKPIVARAVSEGGHDPFNVYALADDDAYRRALLDAAANSQGLGQIQFDDEGLSDTNGDGQVDMQDATYDQYRQMAQGQFGDKVVAKDTAMRNMYGDVIQTKARGGDALDNTMSAYQAALDDFITQAAPSAERNLNQVDFTFGALGGMPRPGAGDSLDYAGTGPAFPAGGGGGLGQAAASLPAGDDPAMAQFMEQYLRDHGVDIEGNRRRRDSKRQAIRSGVRRAAGKQATRSTRKREPLRSPKHRAPGPTPVGGQVIPGLTR